MNTIPDLFGSLYFAALDDRKFNELIDLAETTLGHSAGDRDTFEALRRECERHIAQAEKLMTSLETSGRADHQRPVFHVDTAGIIRQPNPVARDIFDIAGGEELAALAQDAGVAALLCRFAAGRVDHAPVLRLTSKRSGKPVVLIVETAEAGRRARVSGMDVLWHDDAARATRVLYGLTGSEAEVLGLLTLGHTPAEVADLRGRSVETVRQQIRAIIQKMAAEGTQEAVHLARAVAVSSNAVRTGPPGGAVAAASLALSDGRTLDFLQQGAADGEPVFFLHGCLGGRVLPRAAQETLAEKGFRLIAPARPWHGQSSGLPALLKQPAAYARDLQELAEHLGIRGFSLLAYDAGTILALSVADPLKGSLKSIVCAAAQPPMHSLKDFASAPQQQRVFATLARISPPLLRYLSVLGDRKLKKEGMGAFAQTVFSGSQADLEACEDPEILELMWTGHHFHVETGSDGFINDCRLIASNWSGKTGPVSVPLHFVHGGRDVSIDARRIETLAARFGAELSWVPDAGHVLPFSHWQDVLRLL